MNVIAANLREKHRTSISFIIQRQKHIPPDRQTGVNFHLYLCQFKRVCISYFCLTRNYEKKKPCFSVNEVIDLANSLHYISFFYWY